MTTSTGCGLTVIVTVPGAARAIGGASGSTVGSTGSSIWRAVNWKGWRVGAVAGGASGLRATVSVSSVVLSGSSVRRSRPLSSLIS